MKADKFLQIDIVDRFSRMLMLAFAGIVLGLVFTFAYHLVCSSSFAETIIATTIYCIIFSSYVAITNANRKVTKLQISKDYIEFVFEQKNEISTKTRVNYSDIEEYTISPLSDKNNLAKENPDINKFSLRNFGFKSLVKLKDGSEIIFKDSYSDGVLVYSPSYVYRMIDIARFVPDFKLVLKNFDSKRDYEDFKHQFATYRDYAKNILFYSNKRYLACMFKYTCLFAFVAVVLAALIAYFFMYKLGNQQDALNIIYSVLGILVFLAFCLCVVPYFASAVGQKANTKFRNAIKQIIEE